MSLFWRIFLFNAAVLVAGAALLLLGPATVSTPFVVAEALILAIGIIAMLVVNAALLRVGLAPLQRLAQAMTTIDARRPNYRPAASGGGEIADLITTFNTMLDRIESERATSSAIALSAQEAERHRIAQELHDEVGQTLTAVLLDLKRVADQAPAPVANALHHAQDNTRESLDEIRRIARRLRPGVLEELGLASALRALATEVPPHTGLAVHCQLHTELDDLGDPVELVLYRVAQEALTNAIRHADATRVDLTLRRTAGEVVLRICDDGRGRGRAPEGAGIRGMRERALLIDAELTLATGPEGGTEIQLHVPAPTKAPSHA